MDMYINLMYMNLIELNELQSFFLLSLLETFCLKQEGTKITWWTVVSCGMGRCFFNVCYPIWPTE